MLNITKKLSKTDLKYFSPRSSRVTIGCVGLAFAINVALQGRLLLWERMEREEEGCGSMEKNVLSVQGEYDNLRIYGVCFFGVSNGS